MDLDIASLIDLFAATKQTEGQSPKTISCYRNMLGRCDRFHSNGHPAKLGEVSIGDARAFVASMQARKVRCVDRPFAPQIGGGLSPHTIRAYVRSGKAFSSWMAKEGLADTDIFSHLKRHKVPEAMIEILSDDELAQLFGAINPNRPYGARHYAICMVFLDTGIRASELCTLTLGNTFFDDDVLKVTSKANKERMVPFGSTAKRALARYVSVWRPEPLDARTEELFLSVDRVTQTPGALRQAIKRLSKRTDIPRLHPYLFRHTFAVRYLMNGGDVMTLKLIPGHTTLDVAQIYMHLAESHVQVQQHRFSRADRLQPNRRRGRKQ